MQVHFRDCKVWNVGAQLEAASQYMLIVLCVMQKTKAPIFT